MNTIEQIWTAINFNDIETFNNLIDSVDINYTCENSETFLFKASKLNHIDIVKSLLQRKANINIRDEQNISTLKIAVFYHSYDCIKLLIKHGADIELKTDISLPIHVMNLNFYDPLIVKLLVDRTDITLRNFQGRTILFNWNNNLLPIDYILSNPKCDINIKDQSGRTALFNHIGNSKTAKKLIDRGCDINIQDNNGITLLLYTIRVKSINGLKLLLKYKHLDKMKNSLILRNIHNFWSRKINLSSYKIMKLIAKHGIGNLNDYEQLKDCLYLKLILKYVDINTNIISRIMVEDNLYHWLFEYPHTNLNFKDQNGKTALIKEIKNPSSINLYSLIKYGCDVNIKDNNGKSFWDYLDGIENRHKYLSNVLKYKIYQRNKKPLFKQCIWCIKNNRNKFDENRLKRLNKDLRKYFFVQKN